MGHAMLALFSLFIIIQCFKLTYSSGDEWVSEEEREKDLKAWVSHVKSRNTSSPSHASTFQNVAGNVITVDQSGAGDFTTVRAAVSAVPQHNTRRIIIQINAGIYKEKIEVPKEKPYITFRGGGRDVTKITWHSTADSSGSTTGSASVGVNSDYFIARDITFENSAPPPPSGSTTKQAVALRISGDMAAFYNCNFLGNQDTLFDAHGRHYFQDCFIQGSVDFICGDGQSLYMGCELHAKPRHYGSLTAQKRSKPSENTGFSFVNCKVTGSGMLYLGRAWGPYSRVVFSYTFIDDIIVPSGWYNWGDAKRQRTVFYGQYKCYGPGASTNSRVGWSHELTAEEANAFQTLSFIDGESWLQT